MRLAAVADIHLKAENHERDIKQFSAVNDLADALVIAGDLTNHGNPEEMKVVLGVLEHIHIPVIAVLGNHDHESGHQDEIAGMLRVSGVHLLDGQCFEVDGIGFAGTKGFCGGFAPYELMPFGEQGIKTFVEVAEREAIKLDYGLAQSQAKKKVSITHYSPIKDTIVGEPEPISHFWAAPASSERLKRIDRFSRCMAMPTRAHSPLKRNQACASATWLCRFSGNGAKNTHSRLFNL